jgi:antitoxin ParD1/3/4
MTITLTPEQERIVAEQIRQGRFETPEQVVSESLHVLKNQEAFIQGNLAEIQAAVQAGLEDVRDGRVVDGEAAIASLVERNRQRVRP